MFKKNKKKAKINASALYSYYVTSVILPFPDECFFKVPVFC